MSKIKITIPAGISLSQSAINDACKIAREQLKQQNLNINLKINTTKKAVEDAVSAFNSNIKSENLSVKIPVTLKATSVTSSIKQLQKNINSSGKSVLIKAGLDVEKSSKEIESQLKQILAGTARTLTVDVTNTTDDSFGDSTSDLQEAQTQGYQKQSSAYEKIKNLLTEIVEKRTQSLALTTEENQKYQELLTKISAINSEEDKANVTSEIKAFEDELNFTFDPKLLNEQIEATRANLSKLSTPIENADQKLDEFAADLKSLPLNSQGLVQGDAALKLSNQVKEMSVAVQDAAKSEAKLQEFSLKKSTLSNNIISWMNQHKKAAEEYGIQLDLLLKKINALDGTRPSDNNILTQSSKEFKNIQSAAKASGALTDSIFTKMGANVKKFIQWYGASNLIMKGVTYLHKMFTEVQNIDTAMTNLKKVTDASDSAFDRFLENAITKAKTLGASVSDLVNATAEFSRVGYDLNQAELLGQAAVVYQNVGDGITATDASQSIISTLKAFDIDPNDVMSGVVDKYNEVGNNFAISATGLGQALERSAAALNAAGNNIDQSIALITAANAIAQNPESVGNAFKVVSARIRGAKAELEDMGEDTSTLADSTSKLRDELLGLTGVDIMKDGGKAFKDTYTILEEISEVWDQLTDVSRATVLEDLAGKMRSNVIAGLMTNFDEAREVLEASQNAEGSAMEEQARWIDSIEGRIGQLKAAFQDFSATVIDSDLVKNGTKFLTSVLGFLDNTIDRLGALPVLIGALTAKTANVGRL